MSMPVGCIPRRDSSRTQVRALLRYGQDNGLAAHHLTRSAVGGGSGDIGGARGYTGHQAIATGESAADGRHVLLFDELQLTELVTSLDPL